MINKITKCIIVICTIICLVLYSCSTDKPSAKTEEIVKEWMGKEIIFPQKLTCVSMNKDTTCIPPNSTPYKILVYIDSIGCMSCKLDLHKWNTLIEEVKDEMGDLVNFQFYFHPKDIREIQFLFRRDTFRYPSHIDTNGLFNKLNNLPAENRYQTFLLDKANKIILIGDPTNNYQLWNLYKRIIKGESNCRSLNANKKHSTTSLKIEKETLELKKIVINKTSIAKFTIKYTGARPLIITNVSTACGCAIPIWTKQPILPNKTANILVHVTPEDKGYFEKTITIHCNTKQRYAILTIKGIVKNYC